MHETEIVFTNIYNEDKTKLYRFKSKWNHNSFNLVVLEPNAIWSSAVCEQDLKELAERHKLSPEVYYENVKKYICTDHENIFVEIKGNQLVLFLQNPTQKLFKRFKYFFIELEQVNYENGLDSFLDDFNHKYQETVDKLKALQDENKAIIKEKNIVEEHLRLFTELKCISDNKMYSAFTLLLNEKKHRIRFLTELLEEYMNKGKTYERVVLKNNEQVLNNHEAHSDNEGNLSDGSNSDNEVKKIQAVPSTSKEEYDFLDDNSPPPALPKRIRLDKDAIVTKEIEPTSSFVSHEKINEDVKINPDYDADTDEDNEVQFNTQDFLDKM